MIETLYILRRQKTAEIAMAKSAKPPISVEYGAARPLRRRHPIENALSSERSSFPRGNSGWIHVSNPFGDLLMQTPKKVSIQEKQQKHFLAYLSEKSIERSTLPKMRVIVMDDILIDIADGYSTVGEPRSNVNVINFVIRQRLTNPRFIESVINDRVLHHVINRFSKN